MKQRALLLITVLELLLVVFLGYRIYKQQRFSLLSPTIISPISGKNTVFMPQGSGLDYYYEPKADSKETVVHQKYYRATYTINTDSLNERFDYSPKKAKTTYRIVAIGDSFTFGLYVNTKDNWVEQLEDLLNKLLNCPKIKNFEVINLGVYGYDINYTVARFEKRGLKYNPDLVVWFLKSDDFLQDNETLLPKFQRIDKELKDSGEYDILAERGVAYPAWSRAYAETLAQWGKQALLENQKQYLQKFKTIYKNRLAIFTFPFLEKTHEKILYDYFADQPGILISKDIDDIVYKVKDAVFPFDLHPNKKGHTIIAKNIFASLTQNIFSSCQVK